MQNAESSHSSLIAFSHILCLVLGLLIGLVVSRVVSFYRRRRHGNEQAPYWARLLWEVPLGLIAAAVAFRATHHAVKDFSYDDIGEAMIHTLFVVLAFELVRTVHSLEKTEFKVNKLDDRISNDERIILARDEPSDERRRVNVVGIEELDSGQLPGQLKGPPGPPSDRKWAVTISILRVERVQDLLFSPDYLHHFLQLHTSTEKQYRILVIKDKPRSEAAIRSFLQMSEEMPLPNRIRTYIYLKSEFYMMLNCVDKRLSMTDAQEIRKIMAGQPDLSLMRDESSQALASSMTATDDYLLRYRGNTILEFSKHLGGILNIRYVDYVYKLMHAAIREPDREGLRNLKGVLCNSVPNPWLCERMVFLKKKAADHDSGVRAGA